MRQIETRNLGVQAKEKKVHVVRRIFVAEDASRSRRNICLSTVANQAHTRQQHDPLNILLLLALSEV